MARAKSKSKPKSNRGGSRPGSGRKTALATKLRKDLNAAASEILIGYLPDVFANLKALADGIRVKSANGVVYEKPPDVAANIYLCDRALGKPRQSVEIGGKDGSPIPIMICLPDNGRDHKASAELGTADSLPGHVG